MSALQRTLGRLGGRRFGRRPAVVHARSEPEKPELTESQRELMDRRERLTRDLAEIQWDLGGLTYEMAIRDHFRLDVLTRHAAQLQEVDAELGAVERLVHLDESGAAGFCQTCGALHARGAVFCWQCGSSLMERAPMGGGPGETGGTADLAEEPAGHEDTADGAETGEGRDNRFRRPADELPGTEPAGSSMPVPGPQSPAGQEQSTTREASPGTQLDAGPQSPAEPTGNGAGPQSPRAAG